MNDSAPLQWIATQHEPLVAQLLSLAQVNSGSENATGLATMAQRLSALFAPISDHCELIDLPATQKLDDRGQLQSSNAGQMLHCSRRPNAPVRVLLCGHMDTVFPKGSSFQDCRYIDDNCVNGPGVADMKGGLLVMLTALTALEQSPLADQIGWDVLINADEEIGSMASSALMERFAAKAHVGLVYEPALADGTLAGARKGSGIFSLAVTGMAAHVGREFERGRNAIAALATAMTRLHQLNSEREQVVLNLGRIAGGGVLNSVADQAICHFNVRTQTPADEAWVNTQLEKIVAAINGQDGLGAQLHGHFHRPPKPMTAATEQLFSWLSASARQLDVTIRHQPTGGCCDGNNLSRAGLPTIDTLGVRGGNIHTDQEFVLLDSLVERTQLSFLLLEKLATNSKQVIINRQQHAEQLASLMSDRP